MTANTVLDELTAAELSQAAYPATANLVPQGWVASQTYSGATSSGADSFTTFVDTTTQQVVIAFKGSDVNSNFVNDITTDGC
jgi:hypothetical protein